MGTISVALYFPSASSWIRQFTMRPDSEGPSASSSCAKSEPLNCASPPFLGTERPPAAKAKRLEVQVAVAVALAVGLDAAAAARASELRRVHARVLHELQAAQLHLFARKKRLPSSLLEGRCRLDQNKSTISKGTSTMFKGNPLVLAPNAALARHSASF